LLTDTGSRPSPKSLFKNPLLYSSLIVAIALLIVLWILFSRWQENRSIERRASEESARKQLENDRITLEQLGGKDLAIQSFYASPGAVHKGENLQLCYGVANAKTVKLASPSQIRSGPPTRAASAYHHKKPQPTLTISDASGNIKTQSLQVKVE